MNAVNDLLAKLGVDATTAGVWLGAGVIVALIMIGRRPLGLFGDLLISILGAVAGGWASGRFGLDLGPQAMRIAPSLTETNAAYVGAFAEAFIGALVLLVVARLVIRR